MTNVAARVAAVVVNYNAGDHLLSCVRSLREAGVRTIVVADNASADDSIARLRDAEPGTAIVETGANFGYGGGMNRGVATIAAGPDVLLICNPDLLLQPSAVKTLLAALDDDPELGLVGPRIDNIDGTLYPSARSFPRPLDAAGHAIFGLVAPNNRFTRRYRQADVDPSTARRVDWVSGACFAIRRDLFDRLGGFNEDYFMYLEDLDICQRAWVAGGVVAYEPDARVTHVQGVSAEQAPYRMLASHHRSTMRWWWSANRGVKRLLAPFVAAGLGLRLILAIAVRFGRRGK